MTIPDVQAVLERGRTDTSNAANPPPRIFKTFRSSSARKRWVIEIVVGPRWPKR